jgi:catechol 2,3-dioxygenase-like lactoylglutathione lyase family enzyme
VSAKQVDVMNQPRVLPDSTRVPIRPQKLAHVVLRVSDLPISRAWYLKVLEGWPAFENEMICFLTYDDEHHRIGLLAEPNFQNPGDAQSLSHIAFTYASLGELLATYKRLASEGITPFWTINHGPTISFYYKDPDGNRLELQYDVFEKNEEVDAYFASGAHEENFMGIIFDPAAMIARFEAGDPLTEITARPRLAPGQSPWDMYMQ